MNKLIFILLSFFSSSAFCFNSILAIVDDEVISTNQFNKIKDKNMQKIDKLALLDKLIIDRIENKKILALDIKPNENVVESEIIKFAKLNGIPVDELRKTPAYNSLVLSIKYKVSKLALKQLVIKEKISNNEMLTNKTNYQEIYNSWINEIKQNTYIEIYEDKL